MRGVASTIVLFLALGVGLVAGEWNIINYMAKKNEAEGQLGYSVANYCEAWRMNVEMHNIRGFQVVPGECIDFIGKYMDSTQFKVDVQIAAESALLFLANDFRLSGDGKDAWVFDIDDVLLSTLPYYRNNFFGGVETDKTSLEAWMKRGEAPAVTRMVNLFGTIRNRGIKMIIISSRPEYLREATVKNLIEVGFHGWSELVLRSTSKNYRSEEEYKQEERRRVQEERGYRYCGIMGSQYNSIGGYSNGANRIFKLPSPMYYIY